MLGGVVVDDPLSIGVDFGPPLTLSSGMVVPSSDIIWDACRHVLHRHDAGELATIQRHRGREMGRHYPPAPF